MITAWTDALWSAATWTDVWWPVLAGYLMNNFPTLYEESCLALSALKFLQMLTDNLYQSRNTRGFDPSILKHGGI